MTHQDCLNTILSHICPATEPDAEGVQSFTLEAHCHMVRIQARLTHSDPTNPCVEKRYQYDIVKLTVE